MGILDEAAKAISSQTQPTQPTQTTQTPMTTPASTGGSILDQAAAEVAAEAQTERTSTSIAKANPVFSPDEKASQTRQMLVSGLTGMPTPNMTAEDRAQFAQGKAAGAISVPVVAGATAGATAIAEVLPSVLIHTVEGVKALGAWAEAHPYKAFMLYQVAKELLPGAKKAMGFVKAAPAGE